MRLEVTGSAERQIREAVVWWTENRTGSPALLHSELRRAFELVTSMPGSGALATNVELPGARRVLLRRTGYHLYYLASDEVVTVIALWHSRRESGPPT